MELIVEIPRIHCRDCQATKQPSLGFAEPKKHYTRALQRFAIDLCQIACIQDVAELTGLSWDTVKDIHKHHLRRKCKSFQLKSVEHLAIDEVYLGRKRKFVTLVFDLDSGRVLHVGPGKGKDSLTRIIHESSPACRKEGGFWIQRWRWSHLTNGDSNLGMNLGRRNHESRRQ